MRSLAISFAVVLFVFSISIVNQLDSDFYDENGRRLVGFNVTAPYNTQSSRFDDLQDDNWNDTMGDWGVVNENPSEGIIDTFWNAGVVVIKGVKFLVNVLWNSTLGFGSFIEKPPGTSTQIIDSNVATIINIFVIINHLIAVLQLWSNRALNQGYA